MIGKKVVGALIIVALAVSGTALPARAQSGDASAGWKFELVPFFWASGLKADITSDSGEQTIDVSFSDILKDVHFGAMGTFEGRKGRWGFLFDGMYVDIRKSVPQSGAMPGDVDLKASQSNISLSGTLRLADGRLAFDLLAGARYSYMKNVLTVTSGPYAGLENSIKDEWWDAITGARLTYMLAKAWRLIGYVDIGAGGSQLTWQAKGAVDWRLSRVLSLEVGYRHFYFDRFANDTSTKMAKSGFYTGLGIRF
jgi:hypothetical protein